MRNYFRKYFLLFPSLCLIPSVHAMENNRFSLVLGSLYATLKNYLPAFPLSSFFAKYHFRRRNIEEQNNINNEEIIDTQEKQEAIASIPNNSSEYKKPNEISLNVAEIDEKNNFDQEKDKDKNNKIKINITSDSKKFIKITSLSKKNEKIIENIQKKHDELSRQIKTNFIKYDKQNSVKNVLPKNVDFKIDKLALKPLDKKFFNAAISAQIYNFDREEDLNIIKTYINSGANPDYPLDEFGQTLLMLAVKHQKKKLFDFLINNGANINVRDIHGQTVLHKSIYRQLFCDFITIKDLLKNKADPNILDTYNQTPLFLAIAQQCEPDIIQLLINNTNSANINKPNIFGQTLLMLAVEYQKKELFDFLINKGANINARDIHGQTVLHKSIYRQLFCDFITIENLLEKKANPNILDTYNQTPLFLAIAQRCEPDIIQLLINNTNINQPNIYGITPLGRAMYEIVHCGFFHKENILNTLYKSGVSLINIDNQNNSIFHHLIGIDKPQLKKLINSIIKHTHDFYKAKEGFYKIKNQAFKDSPQNSISIPSEEFFDVDANEKQLITQLLTKQKNHPNFYILQSVMNQMIRTQKILQHLNNNKQTPLQLLYKQYSKKHIDNVKEFFDENKPEEDFKNFLKAFPNPVPKDNWAAIAYDHYLRPSLLLKNK